MGRIFLRCGTEIRKGKVFPAIGDFVELLILCEEERPGFFEEFTRRLVGESRRLTTSPEEFVSALDASEFGALMIAAGSRICEKRELRNESQMRQPIAS